jgi:hypothetical protein
VTETLVHWLLDADALILDTDSQPPLPYLLDEGRLVALDSTGDALFIQAALARAGLNPAEPAFQWLYHRLRTAAAAEGKQLAVRRFSFHDGATTYISCGPRGYVVARSGQPLDWRPNGAADVVFAAEASLPEWDWRARPCHPLSLAAFRPALAAPPEAPAYTPQVQSDLLHCLPPNARHYPAGGLRSSTRPRPRPWPWVWQRAAAWPGSIWPMKEPVT